MRRTSRPRLPAPSPAPPLTLVVRISQGYPGEGGCWRGCFHGARLGGYVRGRGERQDYDQYALPDLKVPGIYERCFPRLWVAKCPFLSARRAHSPESRRCAPTFEWMVVGECEGLADSHDKTGQTYGGARSAPILRYGCRLGSGRSPPRRSMKTHMCTCGCVLTGSFVSIVVRDCSCNSLLSKPGVLAWRWQPRCTICLSPCATIAHPGRPASTAPRPTGLSSSLSLLPTAVRLAWPGGYPREAKDSATRPPSNQCRSLPFHRA